MYTSSNCIHLYRLLYPKKHFPSSSSLTKDMSGWQNLAAFRREQKWQWKFSSSAYLQFSPSKSLFDQNFTILLNYFLTGIVFRGGGGWQLCVVCKLHTVCTSKLTERGQNQKRWQNQKVTRCPTLATRATFFKARRCSSVKRVGGKIDVPVCNFYHNRVRSLLATLVTNSVTD